MLPLPKLFTIPPEAPVYNYSDSSIVTLILIDNQDTKLQNSVTQSRNFCYLKNID